MNKLILAVVVLTVTAPVMAEQVSLSVIKKCAVIQGDVARLKCYDQIIAAHRSATAAVNAQVSETGKWTLDKKANPIDDSKTVNISLEADSGGSRFSKPIMLIARCDSTKTEMYIDWQTYLGSEAKVTLRIGANEAKTSKWSMPTDRQTSFNNAPISTLKEMLTANKMVAQITPFNQDPYTAVFNISGLDEAIKPLRAACEW